jgi:hypothetical protein
MFVNVFAEDDLLLYWDSRIEVYLQFASAFRSARKFHPELLFGKRFEVGRVTPELILSKGLGVM